MVNLKAYKLACHAIRDRVNGCVVTKGCGLPHFDTNQGRGVIKS